MKMDERIYTIPLRDAFTSSSTRRTRKAVNIVKSFLKKHTKIEDIKLDSKLNEALWDRGIKKPPRRVKVRVVEEDERVVAYLVD